MPETVLVTGATGFVGRHLVQALNEAGYEICEHSSAIGDIALELSGFPGVTHVFHLAGRTFVPESWIAPGPFYKTNVMGTVNVMEFCRTRKISATVLSSYVYGIPKYLPIDEEHPVAAVNPYAHTKVLSEDVARFYERQFGVNVCIVRPFNLYGRGQDKRFLIPKLIQSALDSATPALEVADLTPRRDYLHVHDLVELLIRTMQSRVGGTFNAGYGSSISVDELAHMILEHSGASKPIISRGEQRLNEIPDVRADTTRAKNTFAWAPRISLLDGIRDLIAIS